MEKNSRVVIIGTGISGVSVGRMLQDTGHAVVLLEQAEKPGGLIRCDTVAGGLYHKVGGHVFNSKNQQVLDWFWRHFDKEQEFIAARRNAKVWLQGQLVGYPIENHLYQLPREKVATIIQELVALSKLPELSPNEHPHFASFLKYSFGATLYELYFAPYNQKIWQANLTEIPLAWLEGKLPMPNIQEVLLANILKQEEAEMVHSTFFYPKSGGSQFIIDRLATGLDIRCNQKVQNLTIKDSKWYIEGLGEFDHVIYTGDVRQLPSLLPAEHVVNSELIRGVQDLPANGTTNVFCETNDTDISWLYLPEQHLKAHRIIYTGNFSPNNNGVGGRKTCTVEFSGHVDEATILATLKLLPGNLMPIAFHHEPNSYVIQVATTREKIANIAETLRSQNFHLLGRFAEWEYYNMDKCMERAMEVTKDILTFR